jgi:hypothetical protein
MSGNTISNPARFPFLRRGMGGLLISYTLIITHRHKVCRIKTDKRKGENPTKKSDLC